MTGVGSGLGTCMSVQPSTRAAFGTETFRWHAASVAVLERRYADDTSVQSPRSGAIVRSGSGSLGTGVVRHLPEFPVVDHAFMSRQEIHEPLVLLLFETEELQQGPIVAASRGQSASNQLAKIGS